MKVRKVLEAKGSTSLLALPLNTTLTVFVKAACAHHVGAFVITDQNGHLAGIVSERDIMRALDQKLDFQTTTVSDIMSRDLLTIGPDDDIHEAMDLMITKKIRHLPVLSEAGIMGLFTVRDLLYAMRKADEDETRLFVSYLQDSVKDP